jgi:multicomponent Na+:H+ antiporter subunit B
MNGMIIALLTFWIISAVWIVFARKTYRVIIFFGVFSLITSVIYLFLGAPDVAMAEAGISAFTTIFFIVCVEKYYGRGESLQIEMMAEAKSRKLSRYLLPFVFTVSLAGLFIFFAPTGYAFTELRDQYLLKFMSDVGGENAVTAIYLGYRVYDTLFEALLLVTAVVAVIHLSWCEKTGVPDGRRSEIEESKMAKFTMRIICPIILLFGIYLIMNGHISAGGGFLGGLALATFFICRFLVLGIYDLSVEQAIKWEELVFINIIILPILAIFTGVLYLAWDATELFQHLYLIAMSGLVGMKVACGFFVLFYRYVAVERLPEEDK